MAATDNNVYNWLRLVGAVPAALHQRMRPDPIASTNYEQGAFFDQRMPDEAKQYWPRPAAAAASAPDQGFQVGGMQDASALMPFLQGMAAKPKTKRHVPAVSKGIATRSPAPQQPQQDNLTPSGIPFIPAAAAADLPPEFAQEAAAPAAAPPPAQSGIMEQLQGYLGRLNQPEDRNAAMQDNLLALAIGGLNTAAAASRPGSTTFGSFAEGNAGGLNTMLALRNARRREGSDQSREALGVLGTMANLENSAATRADTKAYREATLGSDAAQRAQREREFGVTAALNRDKLAADTGQFSQQMGMKERELAADAPVRQSQAAENMARAKYYAAGGAAGGPGGESMPAQVKLAEWMIKEGVSPDASSAWRLMNTSKDNPQDAIRDLYSSIASNPMNTMKSPQEIAAIAKDAYAAINSATQGAPSAQGGAPAGLPQGARQAKDGQWYVPDPTSKSGWGRVVTTP